MTTTPTNQPTTKDRKMTDQTPISYFVVLVDGEMTKAMYYVNCAESIAADIGEHARYITANPTTNQGE